MLRIFCVVIMLSCNIIITNAQTITILDHRDNSPIPGAHVCTESKDKKEVHFWVTNNEGVVENKLLKKSKAAISFIGYQTIIDSLIPNKSYVIKLKICSTELNDVVITGQYKPATIDKSIYDIQLINSSNIEAKAASTLGDLLSSETNLQVSNNGVLGQSISMQGLSGEHIKILIDGVPVIGRQDGKIDLTQINLSNIDHVEIIEGPMSVVYGSNALGGVINLISKSNHKPLYSLKANTQYESVGLLQSAVNFTRNIKQHQLTFNAGYYRFNGFMPDNKPRYLQSDLIINKFNPKRQYHGKLGYSYFGTNTTLKLSQDFFNEMLLNEGSVFYSGKEIESDSSFYRFPTVHDEQHFTNRTNTKLDLNYRFNEQSQFNLLSAFSYYSKIKNTLKQNLYSGETELISNPDYIDTLWFNSYMSRGFYNYWSDAFSFQAGYDVNRETGNGKRIDREKNIDDYALYFSGMLNLDSILQIQPGIRYIYNSKYNAPLVYSLNIKYDITKKIVVRASYGKGFRSPSLKELYLNFVDANHNVTGNPNLKAEYSQNASFSTKFTSSKLKNSLQIEVKGYLNIIENKIDFAFDPDDITKAQYVNIDGNYKTFGFQSALTYKLHPRFTFSAGYHYNGQSRFDNTNNFTYSPDFSGSIAYHNLKYLFNLQAFYKYHGKKSQFYLNDEEIEEHFINPYQMLDININRPFFNNRLTVGLGVKNLLNVTSIESGGNASGGAHGASGGSGLSSISYGRTYFIKLSYSFLKHQI